MTSQAIETIRISGLAKILACYQVKADPALEGERYTLPDFDSIHWFDYRCEWLIDGRRVVVEPRDCITVRQGEVLEYVKVPSRGHHIFIDYRQHAPQKMWEADWPRHFPMGIHFTEAWKEARQVVDEFNHQSRPRRESSAALLFHRLLLRISDDFRCGYFETVDRESAADHAVREIAHWILLRTPHDINVKELADQHRISPGHLTRRFRQIHGVSIRGFLQNQRLNHCLALIRQGNLSIKEIAWQAGYRDSQHFNKAIRKHFGRAPSSFRIGHRD